MSPLKSNQCQVLAGLDTARPELDTQLPAILDRAFKGEL
jgi:hypothetical protein